MQLATLEQPPYTGEAPLASCHLQGMANILEAQGLVDAKRKLYLAWGFSWDGEGGELGNRRRWIPLANATYGLSIRRHDFSSWKDATAVEAELATAGLPFVAAVDSFYVPSEHFQVRHFDHTLLVLRADLTGATIVDPMNAPEARHYDRRTYELMRTQACVPRFHLYCSSISPAPLTPEEGFRRALGALDESIDGWPDSVAALDAFIDAAGQESMPIRVAEPAAEHLYLAGLFHFLGEHEPQLDEFARKFASLSKRWYFVHTLSVQTETSARSQRSRLLRLLRDLRDREVALYATLESAIRRKEVVGSRAENPAERQPQKAQIRQGEPS